jgi:hypothetical protein
MSCSTFSSLASNTRSSAYFSVNDLPAYFEVSQPFQSFLGKVFAVQVEQNWWQTASLTLRYPGLIFKNTYTSSKMAKEMEN